MESQARLGLTRLAGTCVLALAAGVTLAPPLWAVVCSVKRPVDVFSLEVIPWLQFAPTLEHWAAELTARGRGIAAALTNSAVVAVGSTALALALAAPAGYAIARLVRPHAQRHWWLWLISQRFLPPVVLLVPFFLMMKTVHLLDSPVALILIHAAMNAPFAALILQDLFSELPRELEEAALVDGAGLGEVFRLVVLPLSLPSIAAAGVLCLAFSWNEFLFAVTLTYRDGITMPVVIGGSEHTQGVQFWYVATRSLVALVPPAILAFMAQRFLVRGLTLGAVKG